ncbi:hypothetical protein F0U44_01170 [Nocardioides humilatus]|uniref:Uncharacterized protein n=1 Tax=Nocardioides humilatus TaxID=2607660 RepID=A0A5B1LME7_9ACTN|nr:PD40 domain-containing protein [Nocardioides humilatus]KAA1420980.1 hypothetical protein F0U44_01170 [Nocardioides humilatus]
MRIALTIAAGLLAAACAAGCSDGSDAPDDPGAPVTRSSDALPTLPAWDGHDSETIPIEPGHYLVPTSDWSITDFTVAFPAGWTVQYGHVYATGKAEDVGFYAVVVDEIFHDSCSPEDETKRAVGPGFDDLYAALRKQLGGAEVSASESTTLGGYPATRIDMVIPKGRDVAGCRMAPAGLQIWYSEPADKYFVLLEDATASVYVVDVDGERQVFLTQTSRSASAADRAELQAVLDSIQIAGAPTSEESPAASPPRRDGSIYFAADPRGGKDLADPVTFIQAEFHARPRDLFVSRLGEPVRRVVATDGSDTCPRVSPDGELFAYLHEATLVVAPLDTDGELGTPRVRVHLKGSATRCPEWSPDGRRVGYVAVIGPDPGLYAARPAEVHAVNIDGQDRVVAGFEVQAWHEPAFAWSPDGEAVAFTTEQGLWRARAGGQPKLLWRPDAGDPAEELPMAYDRPTSLAWSRRGEIAFALCSSEPDESNDPYGTGGERWTVHIIDPRSRRVEKIGPLVREGAAAWSPDGMRLAFVRPDGQVRVHDRSVGSTVNPAPGLRRGGDSGDVAWSPAGDQLLFVTKRRGLGYALVSVRIDGSTTERRTPRTWALDWIGINDVDWSGR